MEHEKAIDKKELRKFGLLMGLLIVSIFGVIIPLVKHHPIPLIPWIIGIAFWIWALAAPSTMKGFYGLWMKFGNVLGFINTRIILVLVFYLIVTPLGTVKRLFGYNPLRLGFDKKSNTYRIEAQEQNKDRMEVPF
ncbi:MAG: sxtJ [Clostridiaceae bacterium]|nr:sxtJ [Clostridiaceae bacterium]